MSHSTVLTVSQLFNYTKQHNEITRERIIMSEESVDLALELEKLNNNLFDNRVDTAMGPLYAEVVYHQDHNGDHWINLKTNSITSTVWTTWKTVLVFSPEDAVEKATKLVDDYLNRAGQNPNRPQSKGA